MVIREPLGNLADVFVTILADRLLVFFFSVDCFLSADPRHR